MTSFVVYFDKCDSSENKIHSTTCWYYLNRDRNADTTEWSEKPFSAIAEATRATGVERLAQCCLGR